MSLKSLTMQNETSPNKQNKTITHKTPGNQLKSRNRLSLPKIKTEKDILNEISKNKDKYGPLFLLTNPQNKKEKKPQKNKNVLQGFSQKNDKNAKEENYKALADFNVFNNEDLMIKNLMYQFNMKKKNNRTNKLQRRQDVLNKLYGYNKNFAEKVNEIKQQKYLNLTKYQNNILGTLSMNMNDQYGLMDLLEKFNELKDECESVSPLPRINIQNIYEHVYNTKKSKSPRKMPLREFLERKDEPRDEFEREERLIYKIKGAKSLSKKKRNKMFDNLPGYLKDIFNK